jgi:hypothetical protein
MAAAARQATGPSLVPLVFIGTLLAAGAGIWFGYPGLILLIAGVAVSAFVAPPAILTGKKDANGFPTAISPGEQTAMNRFRMWGELKWRIFVPTMDWLPGWPLRMWWLVSVPLAAATLALPSPELGEWWRLANALGVFVTLNVANGSIRRWTAPDDICDGPTVGAVVAEFRRGTKMFAVLIGAFVLAVAVFVAVLVLVEKLDIGFFIDPMQPWQLGLSLGLATLLTVVTLAVRAAALEKWRTMVRVRAEWSPRWLIAKLEQTPHLLDHSEHGSIQVDSFESHASVGVSAIYPLVGKITASIGAGARVAILESPNVDSQNQPVEGSKHALRFRVVTFLSDDMPDLNDPSLSQELAELLIAAAASWVSDSMGAGRWVFLDASPIHDADPDDEGNVGSGAWVAHFAQPDGPDYSWMRNSALGDLSGSAGAEALVDHRVGELYLGSLTDGTTRFLDPGMEKKLADLALSDLWGTRWSNILKMGAVQPRPEHGVYAEATVGSATLFRQPFVVQQGMDPLDFFKLEPKISTTLSAAPFVAVTGFSGSGDRPGERHPQAFCVTWSSQPVASNPDKLVPTDGLGPRWVLSGRINTAFDAARLARPEVSDVRALTDRKSRGHLWEIKLRLHGGVTLAEVRTAAQKLRQHLGSDWLRVAEAQDGCVIIAGADPKDDRRVMFARPEQKNRDYVTSLDWEQAFSDAKLQNSAGVLPKLSDTSTLPSNDQVQVLDFKLPTGTDRSMVKASISKLQTATGNAFVEVRPSPKGADHVRILVSREHPLPSSASVNWDVVDASTGPLFFGTGVEGEPVGFDPKSDPHLLVVGASGGGKATRLTDLIPVPVSSRFPDGWATNGSLIVGDMIFAADGTTTKVVGFSEVTVEPVYDVRFSDGQVVGVGASHLWKVSTTVSRSAVGPVLSSSERKHSAAYSAWASSLRELAQVYTTGVSSPMEHIANIAGCSAEVLSAIDGVKFLGTELTSRVGRKSVVVYPVGELLNIFASFLEAKARCGVDEGSALLESVTDTETMFASLGQPSSSGFAVRLAAPITGPDADLAVEPYALGVWLAADAYSVTTSKRIPARYLRASFEQRLALLQGFMDSVGEINADGSAVMAIRDERLAVGVIELIRTLGIRVDTFHDRLEFNSGLPVFRIAEKLDGLRSGGLWNYVEDITVGEPESLRCIMVDNPDHLYLTHQFVPTHNSVSLQVVIYPALVSGAELYVIDPTKGGADFQFAAPYAKAFAATDVEAVAVMKAVYAEVIRRKNLNAANGVGGYRELPEDIRPNHIYVVMDEFTSLMQTEAVQKTPFDDPEAEAEREETIAGNQRRQYIGTMTGKIAREARSAGVTLILATQKLSAVVLDSIPGANDLKTNLARMLMGNATFGEKMSALKNPMEAPEMGDIIPKGRGLWESTEGNARLMQVWFEPSQSTFAAKLAERRTPLTAEEKLDLAPFIRSTEKVERPLPSELHKEDLVEPEIVNVGEFEFTLDDLDDDVAPELGQEIENVENGMEQPPAGFVEPIVGQAPARLSVVIASPGADVGAFADRGVLVTLPGAQTSESAVHGWWKIEAALAALEAHEGVTTIIWIDSDLNEEDELGIPYVELVRDVFEAQGIVVEAIVPVPVVIEAKPAAAAPPPKVKLPDIESPDFAEPATPRSTIFDDMF